MGLRSWAAIALSLAAGAVAAQIYPAKPVGMVVPFTAGGATDTVARMLGQAMTKPLGQTVVVENVGGAGGTVGATRVKNAAPDGYTLLLHHIGMSTAPALYRKLAYNPATDFEMIGMIVDVPMTMIASSASRPRISASSAPMSRRTRSSSLLPMLAWVLLRICAA